jgi:DNA-binding PucR family transcriptional regulator
MAHINQLLQIDLKQFPLWLLRLALGLHRFSPASKTFVMPSGKF